MPFKDPAKKHEHDRAYKRKYKLTKEQRARERQRAARIRAEQPELVRDRKLRSMYGITANEYDALASRQGQVCAVCKQPSERGRLRVDHDHTNGIVRGLLCDACNLGIGKLGDNPDRLDAAAAYLRFSLERKTGAVPEKT